MVPVVLGALLAFAPLRWARASSVPEFLTEWTGLVSPEAIAIAPSGAIYVLDAGCPCVRKFHDSGSLLHSWGSHGSGPGQFDTPTDLTVDANGNVYVTDRVLERVQKFDANGGFLLAWGQPGFGTGQFDEVRSISADPGGAIVTLDGPDGRVQRFDPGGTFLASWPAWLDSSTPQGRGQDRFATLDHILVPLRLEVEPTGFVILSHVGFGGSNVFRFSMEGVLQGSITAPEQGAPPYSWAQGVGVDGGGRIYTTDVGANRVLVFDAAGTPLAVWGSTGSAPGQFMGPADATGSLSGRIYVVDSGNARVQVFHLGTLAVPDPPASTAASFRLFAAPSPLGRATTLGFTLPGETLVDVRIHDLAGRVVARLAVGEAKPAGEHRLRFDAGGLTAGVYFFRVDTRSFGSRTLKLVRANAAR